MLNAARSRIHCCNETAQPSLIEILLNESNETEWLYRRNQKVRRSLVKIELESNAGVKFLCPEIVLLYKSKNPRAKDEQDFQSAVGHLNANKKNGLNVQSHLPIHNIVGCKAFEKLPDKENSANKL
jgi:hypothetical protein